MKKDLKELFSKFFFRLIYSMHKNLDKIKFNKLKKLKTYFFCYQKYKKGRFHFFFLNMKKKKKRKFII